MNNEMPGDLFAALKRFKNGEYGGEGFARVLRILALAHQNMGNIKGAIVEYKALLAIYRGSREVGTSDDISELLAKIGDLLSQCGEDNEALAYYEEHVELCREDLAEKIKEDEARAKEPPPSDTIEELLSMTPEGESWSDYARHNLADNLMKLAWCNFRIWLLRKDDETSSKILNEVLTLMREAKGYYDILAKVNAKEYGGTRRCVGESIKRIERGDFSCADKIAALMRFKCGRVLLARKAQAQNAALGPTGELADEQIVDDVFSYIINDVYELCEALIKDSSALVIQKPNAQGFKKLKKLERERKILEDFVGCSLDAFFQRVQACKQVFWGMKTIGLAKPKAGTKRKRNKKKM